MRFYWANGEIVSGIPFGEHLEDEVLHPPKPYMCIYLLSEFDNYIAKFKTHKVGVLMAERYIRRELKPLVKPHVGEVLLAKDYP